MPKGRGSNRRRQSGRQHRPKDKTESTGRGYLKLQLLGNHAEQAVARRREASAVAQAVEKRRLASGKARVRRWKARQKWVR